MIKNYLTCLNCDLSIERKPNAIADELRCKCFDPVDKPEQKEKTQND